MKPMNMTTGICLKNLLSKIKKIDYRKATKFLLEFRKQYFYSLHLRVEPTLQTVVTEHSIKKIYWITRRFFDTNFSL